MPSTCFDDVYTFQHCSSHKGSVKVMQRMKIAHSILQSNFVPLCNFKLAYVILHAYGCQRIFQNPLLKSVHFNHVHSQLFAPANTLVDGKVFPLSYHAMVIFEQLILFFKGSFSRQCISRNHGGY